MRVTTAAGLLAVLLAIGLAITAASPPPDPSERPAQKVVAGEVVGTPVPQDLATSSSLPIIGASASAIVGIVLLGAGLTRSGESGGGF